MPHKPSKNDSWSSLLSELGVDDPVQRIEISEPTPEREPETAAPTTETATLAATVESSPAVPPGKAGKFGLGIMSDAPPLSSGTPKKQSFFDRLASISLFGAGATEKINPKAIVPTVPETSGLAEEILEPKKLQKVEETPREPKKEDRPKIGAVDPWSKIATQLGVQASGGSRPVKRQPEEEPQLVSPPAPEPVDEIPDIESMVSFRNLPKKKKFDELASVPPPVERVEHVSEPKRPHATVESPRIERSEERESRRRGPRDERRPDRHSSDRHSSDRYSSDRHSSDRRSSDGRKRRFERSEFEETDVVSPARDLDDDVVVPTRRERGRSLPQNDHVDEERSASPGRQSRNPRSRPRKFEKTERGPSRIRNYTESQDDFSGDFADDYEVLAPPPEREYGPPRDVFADLLSEDVDSRESYEPKPGHSRRGSKVREPSSSYRERTAEIVEEGGEDDPFAHFNKKSGRGSRAGQSRRGTRHVEGEAGTVEPERSRDDAFDEEESSYSRSRSESSTRGRGPRDRRGPSRVRTAELEEAMDEQSRQEEQEMMQLHRSIPGWDDAILPIIESNINRHNSRPSNHRKGHRK